MFCQIALSCSFLGVVHLKNLFRTANILLHLCPPILGYIMRWPPKEWLASFFSVCPNIPPETVFLCLPFFTESAPKYIWPFSSSSHKTQMSHLDKHLSCFTQHNLAKYVAGELVTHCQGCSTNGFPLKLPNCSSHFKYQISTNIQPFLFYTMILWRLSIYSDSPIMVCWLLNSLNTALELFHSHNYSFLLRSVEFVFHSL